MEEGEGYAGGVRNGVIIELLNQENTPETMSHHNRHKFWNEVSREYMVMLGVG